MLARGGFPDCFVTHPLPHCKPPSPCCGKQVIKSEIARMREEQKATLQRGLARLVDTNVALHAESHALLVAVGR